MNVNTLDGVKMEPLLLNKRLIKNLVWQTFSLQDMSSFLFTGVTWSKVA